MFRACAGFFFIKFSDRFHCNTDKDIFYIYRYKCNLVRIIAYHVNI